MKPVKIAISGLTGRMGQAIERLSRSDRRVEPIGGVGSRDSARLERLLKGSDVLIDVSLPGPALKAIRLASKERIPAVVAVTGFTASQIRTIEICARRSAILLAPNLSPGMNLLFALARRAAGVLPGYDAAVSETHHTAKRDSPSGSALRLGSALKEGSPKGRRKVQTTSLRLGKVVGDHTVHLSGPEETLEISHRATSRDVFARGALDAAVWLRSRRKRPRIYTMEDVLGL